MGLERCIKTQGFRVEAGGEAADQFTLWHRILSQGRVRGSPLRKLHPLCTSPASRLRIMCQNLYLNFFLTATDP